MPNGPGGKRIIVSWDGRFPWLAGSGQLLLVHERGIQGTCGELPPPKIGSPVVEVGRASLAGVDVFQGVWHRSVHLPHSGSVSMGFYEYRV